MGCGCSSASDDVKAYHERMGSCDSLPKNPNYGSKDGLGEMVNSYEPSPSGGNY